MGVLDEVSNLRSQGISDNEIIASLRGRGVSPKEINDALAQDQIKNAVGSAEPGMQGSIMDSSGVPGETQAPQMGGGYSGGVAEQADYGTAGQPMDYGAGYDTVGAEAPQMLAPQVGMDYGGGQMGADYGGAGGGGYSDYYGYGGGTETIIEVAEQVFIEKSKKMMKQISENNEFKALASSKIEDISNRLKRIENSMDKLQSAILEKVGEYGNGLQSIKKEMDMMQDSFKKVVSKGRK